MSTPESAGSRPTVPPTAAPASSSVSSSVSSSPSAPSAPKDAADLLAIGEVSRRSGLAVSAIRYYEELGLIGSERTPGGQRRFHRFVLRRLAVIHAAQRVGVPLARIAADLAPFPLDSKLSKRDWVALSRRWRPELDARIAELESIRDGLSMCIGCGCLSMRQCAIYNPEDELGAAGPGPRRKFPQLPDGDDGVAGF